MQLKLNIIQHSLYYFMMSTFINTPERFITEPVAPGAPRKSQSECIIHSPINLSAYMCDSSDEESSDCMDALVFPELLEYIVSTAEIEVAEDVPHPNVTYFRGNNPYYCDDASTLTMDEDDDIPDAYHSFSHETDACASGRFYSDSLGTSYLSSFHFVCPTLHKYALRICGVMSSPRNCPNVTLFRGNNPDYDSDEYSSIIDLSEDESDDVSSISER